MTTDHIANTRADRDATLKRELAFLESTFRAGESHLSPELWGLIASSLQNVYFHGWCDGMKAVLTNPSVPPKPITSEAAALKARLDDERDAEYLDEWKRDHHVERTWQDEECMWLARQAL